MHFAKRHLNAFENERNQRTGSIITIYYINSH